MSDSGHQDELGEMTSLIDPTPEASGEGHNRRVSSYRREAVANQLVSDKKPFFYLMFSRAMKRFTEVRGYVFFGHLHFLAAMKFLTQKPLYRTAHDAVQDRRLKRRVCSLQV